MSIKILLLIFGGALVICGYLFFAPNDHNQCDSEIILGAETCWGDQATHVLYTRGLGDAFAYVNTLFATKPLVARGCLWSDEVLRSVIAASPATIGQFTDKDVPRVIYNCYFALGKMVSAAWPSQTPIHACELLAINERTQQECIEGVFATKWSLRAERGQLPQTISDIIEECRTYDAQFGEACLYEYARQLTTTETVSLSDVLAQLATVPPTDHWLFLRPILSHAVRAQVSDAGSVLDQCREVLPESAVLCLQATVVGVWEGSQPGEEFSKGNEFCQSVDMGAGHCWQQLARELKSIYSQPQLDSICESNSPVCSFFDPPDTPDWNDQILKLGGEKAYEELARTLTDESVNEQHEQAHAFGKSLYEAEGIDGLPVCDDRFLYGCVHELIGQAIVHEGMAIITQLDQICAARNGQTAVSCQHGIGHGILAYLGYRDENLQEALEWCDQLTRLSETGGCYGGVFMEYNLRLMTGEKTEVRVNEDHHYPCTTLDSPYRPACLYWQSQWWRNGPLRSFGTDEVVFAKMGEYCRWYEGVEREACMRGVGNIIAPGVAFETSVIHTLCTAAADTLTADAVSCLSEAAQRTQTAGFTDKAEQLCASLDRAEDRGYCEEKRQRGN